MVSNLLTIAITLLSSWVIANLVEWCVHKYILHNMGRVKGSYWRSHWARHHKFVRKNYLYLDRDYKDSWWTNTHRVSEVVGLSLLVVINLPVVLCAYFLHLDIIAITYFIGVVLYVIAYYHIHKYSHLYPKWGYKYVRWHFDHHMGSDQDTNWNVVFPLWDHILGTRAYTQKDYICDHFGEKE